MREREREREVVGGQKEKNVPPSKKSSKSRSNTLTKGRRVFV
jgi:hypothetical protein